MNLLAIETSCDETAAAVIAETGDAATPWQLRSNVVASQAGLHRAGGGVMPGGAPPPHPRDICPGVRRAPQDAAVGGEDPRAVGGAPGPGRGGPPLGARA